MYMDTFVYSFDVFLNFFLIDLTLKSSNLGKDIIVSLSKGLKFTMENKHAGFK